MKDIIKLNNIKNKIYENELINYNAKQVTIVLRMSHILFTDFKKVWEYDPKNNSFYEFDLKNSIESLLEGIPISHTFKNAVMDFLPDLETKQIQDYGNSRFFEDYDLYKNTPMKFKYQEYVKNEQNVNQKIIENVRFNEKLKNEYEVISFDETSNEK